jgi:outer membrane PBP1 activator LpoA protein
VGGLIAGCAVDPKRDAERVLETLPSKPLAEAQALARSGQPAAAAEAYLKLAEGASAPARQQLEIEAANALLQAGDTDGANRVLLGLNQSALTASQREAALLLQADVALSRGRAAEAIDRLERINRGALPTDLRIRALGSLAAAYRMSGQPIRAAETLDDLDRLLSDREARMDNQVSLLFTLTSLHQATLREAAGSTQGRMRGWIELAQIFAGQSSPSPALNAKLGQWRQRHRNSPALTGLDQAYFATLAGGYAAGTDVAVIIPTGGPFAAAGNTLKDGIQAAYDADRSSTRPSLRFSPDSASAYANAITQGADLVIGPLQKDSVATLAGQGALSVPTLALNRTGGSSTKNLFQFSLAPEDEAVNAANYASAAGLRRAALIYPQSAWGTRMAQAFRTQWRALGGSLVAQPSYGSASAAALEVANADAEVVFLVATSNDVAGLWGALQSAGNRAPVVATSHVYDGELDLARDQALNGLYFVDIPWLLDQERSDRLSRQALLATLPNVSGPLARLYAMGIDAYRLAPRVDEMGRQPGTFFPGETGGLSVDSRGEVHRQLILAQFTDRGVITTPGLSTKARASRNGAD